MQRAYAMGIPGSPTKLLLVNCCSPGDVLMLTAAFRDLHETHPGRCVTGVETECSDLWLHNPYVTPVEPATRPESVIFELPIDDRVDLRRAQGATGDNKDLIKALVEDFDDFVFHIDCDPVEQVRARLPDYHEWNVGEEENIPLELKNVGTSNVPVGRWIITGHEAVLAFDNVADFAPLAAGETRTIQISMRCIAAGSATLHVTILRCANADGDWVVATPVGTGENDSRDGHMTCSE